MKKKAGRPRGSPANHHLFLEGGVWIFRWARGGEDVRRSTGFPKAEAAAARRLRDKWIAERLARRQGVEEIPRAVTVEKMCTLYLEAESQTYDRERGGEQPGTKRAPETDRQCVARLRPHMDFGLAADLMDKERLLDAARGLEGEKFSGLTIRNTFRLLRRVYGWARTNKRKTGVTVNPFDDLEKVDRRRLFPQKVERKAPPFSREELRALYDRLPAHAMRPVRFAAHTGMRWDSEVLKMTWGRVDVARRVYTVDPRWAKRGKEREVPISNIALRILKDVRPASPRSEDPVWLNAKGEALKSIATAFNNAVKGTKTKKGVCAEPRPGWRRPDLHSLRRTCATALSQVASKAIVRAVLGHGNEDVTDLYISVTVKDQIEALNRAAILIDDEEANVAVLTSRLAATA